ncbi:MAG: hypothetical protein QM758_08305 [Armatimonas sp.]
MDSTSGELKIAMLGGWSALPTNDIGKISESEAREIALRKAGEVYKGALRVKKAERQIVMRNRYWIDRSVQRVSETRFVWLVDIDVADEYRTWILVGVDSQTGEPVYAEIQQVR